MLRWLLSWLRREVVRQGERLWRKSQGRACLWLKVEEVSEETKAWEMWCSKYYFCMRLAALYEGYELGDLPTLIQGTCVNRCATLCRHCPSKDYLILLGGIGQNGKTLFHDISFSALCMCDIVGRNSRRKGLEVTTGPQECSVLSSSTLHYHTHSWLLRTWTNVQMTTIDVSIWNISIIKCHKGVTPRCHCFFPSKVWSSTSSKK